jgi:uncharacterized protein YutE (UPF0331/DUF86 family)
MVDPEVLRRRIDALLGYVRLLRAFAEVDEREFVSEPRQHDLAERYLHLAVEAAIDIANHVIADAGYEAPETYRSSFEVLRRHGVIDDSLSTRLQGWAGLRNILVHAYLDIDHELTYQAILSDLGDLEELAAIAARLL